MNNSIGFMLLLQAVLILLNAIFACAEIAVISMNDTKLARLAAQGDKRAVRLARLTSQPARFLATIQVAITLAGFLGSAFAAENFSDSIVTWAVNVGIPLSAATLDTIAVILITLILSYFTLVFGELVPKRLAMRKAESLALGLSGLISAISKIFAPIVLVLTASTNGILRLLRIDPNAEEENVSEEEIRMMVDVGSEKGTIDREEKEFIQNVFEFDDLTAEEIATHRTDVAVLWLEESMEDWRKTIYESAHTLFPVCDGSVDHVVGVLNAKTYFRLEQQDRESVLQRAVSAPYFVPESIRADILFKNMKQTRRFFAIVLDEHGGMTGIITIHDLIEQLVGYLDDNPNQLASGAQMQQINETTWKVSGSAQLDDIANALQIPLEDDEYSTLNGLIFNQLGAIPQDGSRFELDYAGMHIQVLEVKDHQVTLAVLQKSASQTSL